MKHVLHALLYSVKLAHGISENNVRSKTKKQKKKVRRIGIRL